MGLTAEDPRAIQPTKASNLSVGRTLRTGNVTLAIRDEQWRNGGPQYTFIFTPAVAEALAKDLLEEARRGV